MNRVIALALVFLIGVGLAPGVALCQDRMPPANNSSEPTARPAAQVMESTVSYDNLFHGSAVPPSKGCRLCAGPSPGGFPCCGPQCWADASTIGSGNFKTDCFFVFSASRAFFMEPCLPPPPGVDPASHHHWLKFRDRR